MTHATTIKNMYLDYVNNYITLECFASDNDMNEEDAETIVELGRYYQNQEAMLQKIIKGGKP